MTIEKEIAYGAETIKKMKWYTKEEMQKIQKSDYYREDLAKHLGKKITMDVPYYEFKPFKEDKNKACLRQCKVIGIGDNPLSVSPIMTVEHIWVAIKKSVKIDARKPIRVVGVPYEYPHQCGNKILKNVGLNVFFVTQTCFTAV